jgi:CRISPR-associated protein Csm5
MTENKNNNYRYTLKTPVHVGSGEKLGKTDFVSGNNQCIVIDIDSLLDKIKDNKSAINEFSDGDIRIDPFLRKYKIKPADVRKYSIHNPDKINPFNIQEIIKTGMGKPFIPGSSIKGAIRTVLLWRLVSAADEKTVSDLIDGIVKSGIKKEQADSDIDKHFLGRDPNHDFLRGLHAGDVEFEISDLNLIESKVLNLTGEKNFGWKKMGKNGFTSPNPNNATSIFSEAVKIGSSSSGRIKIDEFLLNEPACRQALKFSDEKKSLLLSLPEQCNEFAKDFINSEIKFYKSCKMEGMVNFYAEPLNEIPEDNNAFLLHLGWGSGWHGMTGSWIDEKKIGDIKKRFRLGKSGFPIFPKTRKIVFGNGSPVSPFGWIKIEKVQSETKSKPEPVIQNEFITNFEEFRLRPSPENFKKFVEKIKLEELNKLKELSFKKMKGLINIGFITPLVECECTDEVKNIIAAKLLEVIKMRKNWNSQKVKKYHQLESMASENK